MSLLPSQNQTIKQEPKTFYVLPMSCAASNAVHLCPSLPAADPLIPSTALALLPFDLTGVYLPPARRSNWWTKRPTSDLCWQGAPHVSRLDNSCMQQILFRTVLALKGCKDQSQLKRCKATTCHPFPQRLCSRFFARLVRRRVSELYPILCRTRVGTKYQETEPDLRSLDRMDHIPNHQCSRQQNLQLLHVH